MSNSVFKTLNNHTAQLSRNGFDLSQRIIFNSPAGALLPIFCKELNPGDSVRLNTANFIRSQPLNTSAFARLTQHVDYFFVPYHQLWSYFDQFITGVQDLHNVQYNTVFPVDDAKSPTTLPYLDLVNVAKYLSPIDNDNFGFSKYYNFRRLCSLLGYGDLDSIKSAATTPSGSPSLTSLPVNPFRLLAYQKIFNDYYRLTDFESSDPFSFNVDYVNPYSSAVSYDLTAGPQGRWEKLCHLHYRPYKKDYFTALKPNSLYTLGSTSAINNFVGVQPQFGQNILPPNLTDRDSNNSTYFRGNNNTSTNQVQISVASIRNAFALDKVSRLSMQAGKNFRDQLSAHIVTGKQIGRAHV